MGDSYKHVKEWRKRTKIRAIVAMGMQCVCCKYSGERCPRAMDFHHLDGTEEKEFNISTKILSWDKIVGELKKCVLVCCRCHREIHDGITEIPANARRFKVEEKDMQECPICKKAIFGIRKTCSQKCANKLRSEWHKTVRSRKVSTFP